MVIPTLEKWLAKLCTAVERASPPIQVPQPGPALSIRTGQWACVSPISYAALRHLFPPCVSHGFVTKARRSNPLVKSGKVDRSVGGVPRCGGQRSEATAEAPLHQLAEVRGVKQPTHE